MSERVINTLKRGVSPFNLTNPSSRDNYRRILDAVGDAKVVMIGESSHGTHEFYNIRAEITKLLIEEKGFNAVVVEADWPDAYRLNRYVQLGKHDRDHNAEEALSDFKSRFPLWMWRNTVVRDFAEWLRQHNKGLDRKHERIAFYGMDLYSMQSSMEAVIEYLHKVSPDDAKKAKEAYSLFDIFSGNPQQYGFWTGLGRPSLEAEVVKTLEDLREKGEEYLKGVGGLIDGDELFYAEQNAALVRNAEEYYRKMYHSDAITWNLRDKHMADCVKSLMKFHEKKQGKTAKTVIWAHNSHLGDARASKTREEYGKWNVGQLMREHFGLDGTFSIGFGTSLGTVTAAHKWDQPATLFNLKPGIKGSYEELFHSFAEKTDMDNFSLIFRSNSQDAHQDHVDPAINQALAGPLYERYIGVIYRPNTQKQSHCTLVSLPEEFDSYIYLDRTTAFRPLDPTSTWNMEGVI